MRQATRALRQLQLQAAHAAGAPGPPQHLFARGPQAPRFVAAGLKDVDSRTLSKARRLALAVGTAAGAFGSLVGVGGGVLIVPAIVSACPSIPQRVISGTSLAAVVATGSTAGAVYLGAGLVDATSAALIAAGAVLTAPLGARCTARLDCQSLRRALGWWLIAVAPLVPLKALLFSEPSAESKQTENSSSGSSSGSRPQAAGTPDGATTTTTTTSTSGSSGSGPGSSSSSSGGDGSRLRLRELGPGDAVIAATGCLAGFASGLLGIGGGTVVTPCLAVVTGMPQATVLGTSLAAMIPPSLVGLAQHSRLGNVDWRMGAALAAGTTVGSYVGSQAAIAAPPGVLEGAFAAGMLFLGRKTLQSAAKAAQAAKAARAAAVSKGAGQSQAAAAASGK